MVQLCMQFTIFFERKKNLLEFRRWVNFDWMVYPSLATACAFFNTNKLSCNHISTIWVVFFFIFGSTCIFRNMNPISAVIQVEIICQMRVFIFCSSVILSFQPVLRTKSTTSAFNIVFIQRCTIFTNHS